MDVASFRLGRASLGGRLDLGVGVVAQLLDALGLLLGLLLGFIKVDKVGRHLLDPQLLRLLSAQHVSLARTAGGGRFPQCGGRRDAAGGGLGLGVFSLGEGGGRAGDVLAVDLSAEEGRGCAADDGGRRGARDGRRGLLDGGLVPRGEEVVVGLAGGGVGAVAGVGAISDDDLGRVSGSMSASGSTSDSMSTHSLASLAALFLSSSLYLVAAADEYLVLGSLLLRAAEPPFC